MKGTSGYEFTASGQADMYAELMKNPNAPAEDILVNAFRDSTRWGFRPAHIEKIINAYYERNYAVK